MLSQSVTMVKRLESRHVPGPLCMPEKLPQKNVGTNVGDNVQKSRKRPEAKTHHLKHKFENSSENNLNISETEWLFLNQLWKEQNQIGSKMSLVEKKGRKSRKQSESKTFRSFPTSVSPLCRCRSLPTFSASFRCFFYDFPRQSHGISPFPRFSYNFFTFFRTFAASWSLSQAELVHDTPWVRLFDHSDVSDLHRGGLGRFWPLQTFFRLFFSSTFLSFFIAFIIFLTPQPGSDGAEPPAKF